MSEPAIIRGMSDADYHADPALSSTGAKRLLDCPARFRWDTDHPVSKDAYEVGHAVHTLVLGAGAPIVNVGPSLTAKAAKDKRDQAIADGHTWLRTGDYDKAHAMRDAVLGHPLAAAVLTGGEAEVSVWATHDPTGVRMRARPDYLRPGLVVDLKTTARTADPAGFGQVAGSLGYHISAAYYLRVLELADLADDETRFLHVVVEKESPHLVSVVELDADSLAAGWEQCEVALSRFADCTRSGVWPGYPPDVAVPVRVHPWHLNTPITDDIEGDQL